MLLDMAARILADDLGGGLVRHAQRELAIAQRAQEMPVRVQHAAPVLKLLLEDDLCVVAARNDELRLRKVEDAAPWQQVRRLLVAKHQLRYVHEALERKALLKRLGLAARLQAHVKQAVGDVDVWERRVLVAETERLFEREHVVRLVAPELRAPCGDEALQVGRVDALQPIELRLAHVDAEAVANVAHRRLAQHVRRIKVYHGVVELNHARRVALLLRLHRRVRGSHTGGRRSAHGNGVAAAGLNRERTPSRKAARASRADRKCHDRVHQHGRHRRQRGLHAVQARMRLEHGSRLVGVGELK
mmetsp:Transcript_23678/g.70272  ORF Transcript_23678/g.70272 Transcript_23678/m.70272 type:complete len:302 (+) Transcript_23678:493-1398(+)